MVPAARSGRAEQDGRQRVGDRRAADDRGRAGGSSLLPPVPPALPSRPLPPVPPRPRLRASRTPTRDRSPARSGRSSGRSARGSASRSASAIGPICDAGGAIHARSVTVGLPLSSSIDTSASPTASSVIARSMSSFGIRPQRLGRGLHRLLIARREGAQRVLHAVAELPEHRVGHVGRVLRDEVDADALRADQPHDLLDLLDAAPAARR